MTLPRPKDVTNKPSSTSITGDGSLDVGSDAWRQLRKAVEKVVGFNVRQLFGRWRFIRLVASIQNRLRKKDLDPTGVLVLNPRNRRYIGVVVRIIDHAAL